GVQTCALPISEGRRAQRVLAAVPVPARRPRRRPVQPRLEGAGHPGVGLRRPRGALRRAAPHAPRPGPPAQRPAPGRRRRALALLRAAGRRGPQRPGPRRGGGRQASRQRRRRGGHAVIDLTTRYLGLELASPVVASASPLTGQPETACALEEAGAAAIVMPSLFEEEIVHEEVELHRSLEQGADQHVEASGYFPSLEDLPTVGDRYLATLETLKRRLSIP